MKRTKVTPSKGFGILLALGVVGLVGAPAAAQPVPPPPEYIAITEPVYYEGHAAYWYRDHWYWRDEHGAWGHYEREPPLLAERRAHFAPVRRSWEHWGRR